MFLSRLVQSALLVALTLTVGVLAATPMHAEDPDQFEAKVTGLTPDMAPLIITYNCDNGPSVDRFERDGKYARAAEAGLGEFRSVSILGETVKPGETVRIPHANGKIVTVTVTVTITLVDGEISVTVTVTTTITEE